MPITIRCPNPACGTTTSVADAVSGRGVRCKRCGTPFVARPTLDGDQADTHGSHPAGSPGDPFPALPAEFGRYRVLRLLGRGGMGSVFLAEDTQLGRRVALKFPTFGPGGESAKRAERFVREARAAAVLDHPNVCTVYDAGEIGGRPFISMAYVEGKPLEDAIDPDAPMPQERAAGIARKVALALAHAHAKGIVHRDLKPANVVLNTEGEPVVMDFGLAKRVSETDPDEARLTRQGAVMGTPGYMSPEQVRGEADRIGPATDVYALGAVLFEMLTARTPYTGPTAAVLGQILTAPVPEVAEFRPDADPRLAEVCRRALAKDPADRFPTMAAVAEALGDFLKESADGSEVVSVELEPQAPAAPRFDALDAPPAPARPPRMVGWKWGAATAGPALVVLLVIVFGRSGTPSGTAAGEVEGAAGDRTKNAPAVPKKEPLTEPKKDAPAAPTLAPVRSEWAGLGHVKWRDKGGEGRTGGAWTFVERRGPGFEASWRAAGGLRAVYEGIIEADGRLTIQFVTWLGPKATDRKKTEGYGKVSAQRMTLVLGGPNSPAVAHFDLKLLPDGGDGFNFRGRWNCAQQPNGWKGGRNVVNGKQFLDFDNTRGTWERDGGLLLVHFPSGGLEWLVIDPDNPNKLVGSNGPQDVTWFRQ